MIRQKILCDVCGKYISKSNIKKHLDAHSSKPLTYKLNHDGLSCQFCGRECKNRNSLCNHERLCKQNPNRQILVYPIHEGFNNKGRTAWNKGLTKSIDVRVLKNAQSVKKFYESHPGTFLGKTHSPETRIKIAMQNQGNTRGNRSKKGFYKGIYCGSSYELAYVIFNIDHNIPFSRCHRVYQYHYKEALHHYFPDFELPDGTIIEIKGYHTELVDIKAAAVTDRELKILYKADLKEHFKYVCETYGITEYQLHTLYDDMPL